MEDIYFDSADGKTKIHACIWRPEGKPRGVVQIVHGMCEYAKRYAPTAEFLAENGYLVGADDHLGHGESAPSPEDLGYFCEKDPAGTVLKDLRTMAMKLREEEPYAPMFMLGHSMGSFFARKYMSLYGTELAGAVIVGTGYQSPFMTGAGMALTKLTQAFRGKRYRSKFIDNMAFGSYNKRFRPERTSKDWLSENTENVDAYVADPLCGFTFTCNGFLALFSIVAEACKKETFLSAPVSLPIYIASGRDDPVGNYGKGAKKVYGMYDEAGVEDLGMTIYPGRHEILNESVGVQVRDDILEFFDSHLGTPAYNGEEGVK
ncbi:MAG: alpha/beta hydrolase [Clostridia bacterium]|nr:alpha/beta hydrolase [Clostridia bacterium]